MLGFKGRNRRLAGLRCLRMRIAPGVRLSSLQIGPLSIQTVDMLRGLEVLRSKLAALVNPAQPKFQTTNSQPQIPHPKPQTPKPNPESGNKDGPGHEGRGEERRRVLVDFARRQEQRAVRAPRPNKA